MNHFHNRKRRFTARKADILKHLPHENPTDEGQRRMSLVPGSLNDPAFCIVNPDGKSLHKSRDKSIDSMEEDDVHSSNNTKSDVSHNIWYGVKTPKASKIDPSRKNKSTNSIS